MSILSLEFSVLSTLVDEAFEVEEEGQNDTDLFWDRFNDYCPVSYYGDASYTIVSAEVVLKTIAEVESRIQPEDFFDAFLGEGVDEELAQVRAAAFSARCLKLENLVSSGVEYLDLEG